MTDRWKSILPAVHPVIRTTFDAVVDMAQCNCVGEIDEIGSS